MNNFLYKCCNNVLNNYAVIGINSIDLLHYLNRDQTNWRLVVNKAVSKCNQQLEECNPTEVEYVMKELVQDRVHLYNDLCKKE